MFTKTAHTDFGTATVGRRLFLTGAGAVAIGLSWWNVRKQAPARAEAASAGLPKIVTIVEFSDSGERKSKVSVERIVKTEDEWQKQLTPASFDVTRRAGTEHAYTNENPNNAKGIFRCICCRTGATFLLSTGRTRPSVAPHSRRRSQRSRHSWLPIKPVSSWGQLSWRI